MLKVELGFLDFEGLRMITGQFDQEGVKGLVIS